MDTAISHRYMIPFGEPVSVPSLPTTPPDGAPSKKECRKRLRALTEELYELQDVLYADDRFALLLVFQAMDAAGKDGTIRAVMTGVNPAGCQVFSFKQPSAAELDHDFLWRTSSRMPERGRIGIFNRSYYEEVLVVRVHPEYLEPQKLPPLADPEAIWDVRLRSIRDSERHLAANGTVILKFWLNVSRDEQKRRFLARLDEPEKHWKFSEGDVVERGYWDQYMSAYEDALSQTSRPHAPWYAIPADSKSYMRMVVAEIVVDTLRALPLRYPEVDERERARFGKMRALLEAER